MFMFIIVTRVSSINMTTACKTAAMNEQREGEKDDDLEFFNKAMDERNIQYRKEYEILFLDNKTKAVPHSKSDILKLNTFLKKWRNLFKSCELEITGSFSPVDDYVYKDRLCKTYQRRNNTLFGTLSVLSNLMYLKVCKHLKVEPRNLSQIERVGKYGENGVIDYDR